AIGKELTEAFKATSSSRARRALHVFRTDLTAWHAANSRHYRWREGGEPWLVLLGELCLSRAPIGQAAPGYRILNELASSPRDLLSNEADLRQAFERLGLKRVDEAAPIARVLIERFEGILPSTRDELMTLPGVGDNLASAVMCFGFGQP